MTCIDFNWVPPVARALAISKRPCVQLYQAGMKASVFRNKLGKGNEMHNWQICRDSALILIEQARRLYTP